MRFEVCRSAMIRFRVVKDMARVVCTSVVAWGPSQAGYEGGAKLGIALQQVAEIEALHDRLRSKVRKHRIHLTPAFQDMARARRSRH